MLLSSDVMWFLKGTKSDDHLFRDIRNVIRFLEECMNWIRMNSDVLDALYGVDTEKFKANFLTQLGDALKVAEAIKSDLITIHYANNNGDLKVVLPVEGSKKVSLTSLHEIEGLLKKQIDELRDKRFMALKNNPNVRLPDDEIRKAVDEYVERLKFDSITKFRSDIYFPVFNVLEDGILEIARQKKGQHTLHKKIAFLEYEWNKFKYLVEKEEQDWVKLRDEAKKLHAEIAAAEAA